MPNIKPLKKDYQSVKLLRFDESSPLAYKKLVNLACDGDELFVADLEKANLITFDDTRIKCLVPLTLSYGIKVNEETLKKYILSQHSKREYSIFNLLLNNDVQRIKQALNNQDFIKIFRLIFRGNKTSANKVLTNLTSRVGKIETDKKPDNALLSALINSLLEGKNIGLNGFEVAEPEA